MIDLDRDMLEFFHRSVAQNRATGIPKAFDVRVESSQVTLPKSRDEDRSPVVMTPDAGTKAPPAPTITAVTPNTGPTAGNTAVTIDGQRFINGATVKFGTTPGTNVAFVNANQLTARTPFHVAGLVDVRVDNVPNSPFFDVYENSFTFQDPAAIQLSPWNWGPTVGGRTIYIINGANFAAGTTVAFDGILATAVVITSASTLNCTMPAHAAGIVNVVVHNTVGPDATALFEYETPPNDNPYGMSLFFPNVGDASLWPSMRQGNISIPLQIYLNGLPYNTFHDVHFGYAITGTTNIASAFVQQNVSVVNGQAFLNVGAVLLPSFSSGEIRILLGSTIFGPSLYHVGTPGVGRGDGLFTIYVTVYA